MRKNRNRSAYTALIIGLAVIFFGAGIPFPTGAALAGEKQKQELPKVDGETRLYPGYPYRFDGVGMIDRVGEAELVVSDKLLMLSSGVDLHTPGSSHASIGRFAEGDYVGYQLDTDGAIESLWLLKKGKR
jgi:hypothetical protein